MIEKTCLYCGKKIFVHPSAIKNGKGKFCNSACYHNYVKKSGMMIGKKFKKAKNIKRKCKYCGKNFFIKSYAIKQGKGRYCSRNCWHKAHSEFDEYRGKNWGKYNRIEKICDYCGKKIFVIPWKLTSGQKHIYCSDICRDKGFAKYCSGKNSFCYKREIRKCAHCKKKFSVKPSSRRKYCSFKCYNNTQKCTEDRKCKYCGKVFSVNPSVIKKYCNQNCYHEHFKKTGEIRGENNPNYAQIKTICKYCGKEFFTTKYRLKKANKKYCSFECSCKAHSKYDYKKNPRKWNKGIESICKYCGKKLYIKPHKLIKGEGIFCSRNCNYKYHVGEHHLRWNGGTYPYYGPNWSKENKKARKNANNCSEFSRKLDKLNVHHIIPVRNFVDKFIDLCLKPYIEGIDRLAFRVLPYDLIPQLLYDEMNRSENLIALLPSEHQYFEGMPLGFFDAIKRINKN